MSRDGLATRTRDGSARAAAPVPAAGERLGRYRVVRELGRGGMGIVFLARDEVLERDVALKVLSPDASSDDQRFERFVNEARAAARLDHPGIVKVLDVGEADGLAYFAMEVVAGRSLGEILRAHGPLPVRRALEIALEVARALEHAHAHGIVHRDVKPDNVLVDEAGRARLVDFGLARCRVLSPKLTATGEFVGTPAYASPEHLHGRDVDAGSDVYSLGVTLFEALTGTRPFADAETDFARLAWALDHEDAPSARERVPSLPLDVDTVVAKCLEPWPAHRYSSAGALADDLARCLAGSRIRARPSPLRRLWSRARRRWPSVAAALLGALALGTLAIAGAHARAAARLALEDERREELARLVGDLTLAERLAIWSRVVARDPAFWEGHVERARLLRRLAMDRRRQRDERGAREAALAARRELELAGEIDERGPRPPLLLIDAELCRRFLGDAEEAHRAYELLATRAPASAEGTYARARLALARGDVPAAEHAVRRALELAPALAQAHYLEAEIALGRADARRAVAALDSLESPWWVWDDPERFSLRARALALAGDRARAIQDLEHALELDPGAEEDRRLLQELRSSP